MPLSAVRPDTPRHRGVVERGFRQVLDSCLCHRVWFTDRLADCDDLGRVGRRSNARRRTRLFRDGT